MIYAALNFSQCYMNLFPHLMTTKLQRCNARLFPLLGTVYFSEVTNNITALGLSSV